MTFLYPPDAVRKATPGPACAAEPGAGEGREDRGEGPVWMAACSHGALRTHSHP